MILVSLNSIQVMCTVQYILLLLYKLAFLGEFARV